MIMTSGQPELHTKTKSTASSCYTWEFKETLTSNIRHAEVQTRRNPWKESGYKVYLPPPSQKAIYNWHQLRRENEFSSKDVTGCINLWLIIAHQHKIDCICMNVRFLFCFCIFSYWFFNFLLWFSFLVVVIHFSLIHSFFERETMLNWDE